MSDQEIIVAGAGGHAGMVIETIRSLGHYNVIGLVVETGNTNDSAHGVSVIGTDESLSAIFSRGLGVAANGVGSIKDNSRRRKIYEQLKEIGFSCPTLVHPRAWVADSALLSNGVQVMPGSLIMYGAVLEENVLINSGAIVEHDCRIGAHAHVSTGVRMGGQVSIGEGAFVGIGSSIRQSVRIGNDAIVGAGSVVISDVPDGACFAGVPARQLVK